MSRRKKTENDAAEDSRDGCCVARDAKGRVCCEFQIQREDGRVVAIHAGDVLIKIPRQPAPFPAL